MLIGHSAVSLVFVLAASGEDIPPVGLQKQLFVDDYVISAKENISRQLGEARKFGVVLEPSLDTDIHPLQRGADPGLPVKYSEEDREGFSSQRKPDGTPVAIDFGFYATALWNEEADMFQMWYMAWREAGIGYAESKDGIHWTKPMVGVGLTDRDDGNIIKRAQAFSCMIDPTVEWGAPDKFKAAFDSNLDKDSEGKRLNRCGLGYSSDGIHWRDYNRGEAVTGRSAGTQNQIFWDPQMGKYRLLTRTDYFGDWGHCRTMRIMVHKGNNDLVNAPTAWETAIDEILLDPPTPWEDMTATDRIPPRQMHGMNLWYYEGVYFQLMDVYTQSRDHTDLFEGWDYETRHDNDCFDYFLGTSRDPELVDTRWVTANKPIIPRGSAGSFDQDGVRPMSQIITHNNEHWLFYAGSSERHWARGRDLKIALAKLRLDGFVFLEAGEEWGQVTTKPFKVEGDILEVNIDASDGEFIIEVLDDAGNPFSGRDRSSNRIGKGVDQTHFQYGWRDDTGLSELKGNIVRLRFHLRNARLFSFTIQQSDSN
jgi:hypothetical protein